VLQRLGYGFVAENVEQTFLREPKIAKVQEFSSGKFRRNEL
jgi:hypothetical protein